MVSALLILLQTLKMLFPFVNVNGLVSINGPLFVIIVFSCYEVIKSCLVDPLLPFFRYHSCSLFTSFSFSSAHDDQIAVMGVMNMMVK